MGFIYGYQTVKSESEGRGRLLLPSPLSSLFDLSETLHVGQIVVDASQKVTKTGQKYRDHVRHTTGEQYPISMYCVVNTSDMLAKITGLAVLIEFPKICPLKEQQANANDHLDTP